MVKIIAIGVCCSSWEGSDNGSIHSLSSQLSAAPSVSLVRDCLVHPRPTFGRPNWSESLPSGSAARRGRALIIAPSTHSHRISQTRKHSTGTWKTALKNFQVSSFKLKSQFLQWICCGLHVNWEILQLLLHRHLSVTVCLQETMFGSYIHLPPRGYSAIYSKHDPAQYNHGGFATLVSTSRGILLSQYTAYSPLQVRVIQFHITRTYAIYSFYLPPFKPVDRTVLESLIRQHPSPYLFLGDLNRWHPMWGDNITKLTDHQ